MGTYISEASKRVPIFFKGEGWHSIVGVYPLNLDLFLKARLHLVRVRLKFGESRLVRIAGGCTLVLEVGAPKFSSIMEIILGSLADDTVSFREIETAR